jgi:Tfp pilus assembly PilM family ATPase
MSILQDHAGFNISNSKLQLVELNFENDNLLLENVDEENFSELLTADVDNSNNVDIFRQSFNNLFSRKPLYSKKVSFTLPDNFFRIASIPYESELTEEDLNDHVKWELSILFPKININDYAIQKVKMPVTQFSFTPSILIYAVNKNLVKMIHQFCVDNNLELNFIDNAHVACNNFITQNSDPDELNLSLYLYDDSLSLILLKGSTPVLRTSAKLASPNLFHSVLASQMEKLNEIGLLQSHINKFYIGGQYLDELNLDEIRTSTGIELHQIDPFSNLKTAPSISSGKFVNQLKGSFTAAAGIALRIV